jgi:membrane protease YdiL (CAAX protease family)
MPWRWGDVLIGLAPLVAAQVSLVLLSRVAIAIAPRWYWIPLTVLAMAWMLGFPLWLARRRGCWPRLPTVRTVASEARFALLALVLLMMCLSVVKPILVVVLGEDAQQTSPLEPIAASPDRFEPVALVVLAVLIAPIAEEVFFRGMLYNALRQRLHVAVAAPLQAVVFALYHPFGVAERAAIAFVGLFMAVFYDRQKTLVAPILVHALMNAAGIAVMFWTLASYANAPALGVRTTPHEHGCLVSEVVPGSAAEASGIRIGDVVTAVDNERVADPGGLTSLIRTKRVGDMVALDHIRGAEGYRVEASLKARPE